MLMTSVLISYGMLAFFISQSVSYYYKFAINAVVFYYFSIYYFHLYRYAMYFYHIQSPFHIFNFS